jgi:plasmid stability protein
MSSAAEDIATLKVTAATHERDIRDLEADMRDVKAILPTQLEKLEIRLLAAIAKVETGSISQNRDTLKEMVGMKTTLRRVAWGIAGTVGTAIVGITVAVVIKILFGVTPA